MLGWLDVAEPERYLLNALGLQASPNRSVWFAAGEYRTNRPWLDRLLVERACGLLREWDAEQTWALSVRAEGPTGDETITLYCRFNRDFLVPPPMRLTVLKNDVLRRVAISPQRPPEMIQNYAMELMQTQDVERMLSGQRPIRERADMISPEAVRDLLAEQGEAMLSRWAASALDTIALAGIDSGFAKRTAAACPGRTGRPVADFIEAVRSGQVTVAERRFRWGMDGEQLVGKWVIRQA